MSILRGIGKFLGGLIFSTLLGLALLTLSLAQLTEYNTLRPMVVGILEQQINQQFTPDDLSAINSQLLELCQNNDTIQLSNNTITGTNTLNCTKLRESNNLSSFLATSTFDDIYYKKYNCSVLECLQERNDTEKAMIIFSETANNYFKNILNYFIIGTVIGAIILLVSAKGWGIPKSFGVCLVSVGIPYFVINIIKGMLPIPQEAIQVAGPVINQIFDLISIKFLIVFVIGIAVLVIGLVGVYLTKKKNGKK